MRVNDWIAIVGMLLAVIGVLDSALQRWKKANTSEYAAKRDFEHLRRNQEQLKDSLKIVLEENEEVKLKLVAVETQMNILVNLRYSRGVNVKGDVDG